MVKKANVTAMMTAYKAFQASRFKFSNVLALAAVLITLVGTIYIHPTSILNLVSIYLIWCLFILLFHRELIYDFNFAFYVNSAFITIFYIIQTGAYPDSYGMTSPLSNSWTDDSYFFSLTADTIPPDLHVRNDYFLYSHPYSQLVKMIVPFKIVHPMDAIFFQSGIAATLVIFTKKFLYDLSNNSYLANVLYFLMLICPYLMMNGGVIFIRDTFVAAIFIYSLSCFNSGRYVLAFCALTLQFIIRPGTAIVLILVYPLFFWTEIKSYIRKHTMISVLSALIICISFGIFIFSFDFSSLYSGTADGGAVSILGRELFSDLTNDPSRNIIFLEIQNFPLYIRALLNSAYLFCYPFLNFNFALAGENFDVRSFAMAVLIPIQSIWLNAWFFAGIMADKSIVQKRGVLVFSIFTILIILGLYSLQTRHKTIIYPLYYMVVAIGFLESSRNERLWGYGLSFSIVFIMMIAQFR